MVTYAELALAVLADINLQRIEMTVHIIQTDIPNALMSVFGSVVEVEPYVKTVVGRQAKIIRNIEDIHPLIFNISVLICGSRPPVRHTGGHRHVRRHGDMIAAMVAPGSEGGYLRRQLPTACQVNFMTVVELIIVPRGEKVVKATLVPRQRIGARQFHAPRFVDGIQL